MEAELSKKLNYLVTEVEKVKKEIAKTQKLSLEDKLNEIDMKIQMLDNELKPIQEKKKELQNKKINIEKEITNQCQHELIAYRDYDCHRTNTSYRCKWCKYANHFSGEYKIIETIYGY